MSVRAYHKPIGDPCTRIWQGVPCNLPPRYHRVNHQEKGDPCIICALPGVNHYRSDSRTPGSKAYYVGIDGEGQGRTNHSYVLLAWSDESGQRKEVCWGSPVLSSSIGAGLSSTQCLDFILGIPSYAKIFAFAFGYDLTKILTDVDDETLYRLMRPELRQRPPGSEKYGPKPVFWNGYKLNKVSSKFVIQKGKKRRVIWDVFQFFQGKFTTACEDWKIGEESAVAEMRRMKDQRADFDKLDRAQILEYCYQECSYMASLARRLTEAHDGAGLKLQSYYGAGSSATAILKKIGIHKLKRDVPAEMTDAVSRAFFGGRFENSVIGEIPGPVYGYDISSAYPYQLTFLPCLECGRWEFTKKRKDLERVSHALINYSLTGTNQHWGPFPNRDKSGSICFPVSGGIGWAYKDEFIAGENGFQGVNFLSAWVYRTDCNHVPFRDIPGYYLQRLKIGKEGPGIVIKLGCNSVYGKLAQSVGTQRPFQSWLWAGMVTSGTRAQILEVLALHRNKADMLMVATDGVYSREPLELPKPIPTGTDTEHKKPLGGWETKAVPKGIFAARPGIYFPLQPTADELKQVRARGVGRGVMLAAWQRVVDAWNKRESTVVLSDVTRFVGAKSAISRTQPNSKGTRIYTRSASYGQWITRPIEMSFDPLPKRQKILPDNTLQPRQIGNVESAAYDKSKMSPEALMLKIQTQIILEQADGDDYADYEE